MLRLLIRRLVFKLPTAWQIREDCVLLFHETGVHEFKLPKSNEIYGRLPSSGDSKIWALVDSNQSLEVPAGVFIHGPPFFVVEAASPRSPRLQWLKKVNYEPFYMKRWTFSEVLQAYVDPSYRGSNAHPFTAVRSSGAQPRTQSVNSGICTTNLELPLGRWPTTPIHQISTKTMSWHKFGR